LSGFAFTHLKKFLRVPRGVFSKTLLGRAWDSVPQTAAGRSAKGELKNSPVDCFLRGNALQERAFLYSILYK
jgi:hypothetical protein